MYLWYLKKKKIETTTLKTDKMVFSSSQKYPDLTSNQVPDAWDPKAIHTEEMSS